MCFEIWKYPTKKVKQLVRVLFLNVCKLLGSCIADKWSAALFQKPGTMRQSAEHIGLAWLAESTHVTNRSSLAEVSAELDGSSQIGSRLTEKMPFCYCHSGCLNAEMLARTLEKTIKD